MEQKTASYSLLQKNQQPQRPLTSVNHCPSCAPKSPNQIHSCIHFERLPFLKFIKPLSRPMFFNAYSNIYLGQFEMFYGDKQSILKSWDMQKQEYKIKIMLILQIRVDCVEERLPYNFRVAINDKLCELPALNEPMVPGRIPWQNNVPIDITRKVDLRTYGIPNQIKMTWSNELHNYMARVYMVQEMTLDNFLEELKKRPMRASDKTKELIKESMKNDGDVLVDSIIASVKDPLTNLRMKLPARGFDCMHLQCFDAIQFLQLNKQRETWKCPLCKIQIKFENIVIDEFFLKIIQSPDLSEECDNIVLFKNGTWSEKKNIESSKNSRTNARRSTNNIEVITLEDFDDDADNSNGNQNNADNNDIISKSKRFKYNTLEEVDMKNSHQEKDKSRTVSSVITID